MSDTLNLPFIRFTRQAHTEPMANTVWRATLADAVERLKVAEWRAASVGLAVEMPISDPTLAFVSDAYDTFKSSGDAALNSGRQAAYVGMAAYRFKLPADAFDGTDANVESLVIQAYADKFNWRGILVSAYLSDSSTPSTDWDILRSGDIATPITVVDSHDRGILYDDAPATKTATNKTASVTLAYASAAAPKAYLYVIIQHSDWLAALYEYWIEGAGMLVGATAAVTFDRDVTADAPDTTWAYPVNVDDLIEPSRVYPLDDSPLAINSVLAYGTTASATAPVGLAGVVAVACGYGHILALKADGTVVAWGLDTNAQATVPAGLSGVVAVACGGAFSLALKADGTVAAWGNNTYGQVTGASGITDVVAVACGYGHSLALKADGTVVAWGLDTNAQATVPAGLTGVVAVACASNLSFALKADGTVAAWGAETYDMVAGAAALTGVVALSGCASWESLLALKADGTVAYLGYTGYGQATVPVGLTGVVSVAAGRYASLALKADGTVAAWGNNTYGLFSVTTLAAVRAIAAGENVAIGVQGASWATSRISRVSALNDTPDIPDSDLARKLIFQRVVSEAFPLASLSISAQGEDGGYLIANSGSQFHLSACARAFGYQLSLTDSAPNRLHISLPSLSADAEGEIYLRIVCFKDTNSTPVNPLSTVANWRTVWRGGTPAGHTLLASQKVRHTGFVNSLILPLASPGTEGVLWLCIMPLYAPLAGDSLSWDITQTGFDASRVFLLRV